MYNRLLTIIMIYSVSWCNETGSCCIQNPFRVQVMSSSAAGYVLLCLRKDYNLALSIERESVRIEESVSGNRFGLFGFASDFSHYQVN